MTESNVEFEYDGYTIIADGEVWSPGDIRNISLDFIGLTKTEVNQLDKDTKRMALELAKQELVDSVYESEMRF